jgi:hypothetical protein
MTQDEIKAIKDLISATKEVIARTEGKFFGLEYDHFCFMEARGAINQAQKVLANDALEKKAANAKELGLEY